MPGEPTGPTAARTPDAAYLEAASAVVGLEVAPEYREGVLRFLAIAAEFAAAVLKPYVSANTHWMIEKHGIFQGYYYYHHYGKDRDTREQFRGHPAYEMTVDFCHKYDQTAFDPDYTSAPLSHYEPLIQKFFRPDGL